MKIACISIYDEPYKPVADITVPNLTEYCRRHAYNHHIFRSGPWQRDIVWERIPKILEVLPNYDAVAYFDCDVLITNHNVRLEEFIDRDITLSESVREDGSIHLNDGVLLVKNSEDSISILNKAWETYPIDGINCAQDAFEKIIKDDPLLKHVSFSIERQKRFNSFLYEEYGMPLTTRGNWTVGDFALHLPGCTTERRVEIFNKTTILKNNYKDFENRIYPLEQPENI